MTAKKKGLHEDLPEPKGRGYSPEEPKAKPERPKFRDMSHGADEPKNPSEHEPYGHHGGMYEEGTVKISMSELRTMVRKAVERKLMSEGADFTARRKVAALARSAAMEFENNIVSELGVLHPDQLSEPLQRKYYEIVKTMEQDFVKSTMEAVSKLAMFPKEQKGTK